MRPAWRRIPALAAALCVCGLVATSAAHGERRSTVIVLSWDGMRHDYPDLGALPGLERMQRGGARAEKLIPPFPSSTFPSHVTLATGTHPDRHGIVANRFFDPARGPEAEFDYGEDAGWIDAEPLWAAAERQGVRSAVFFWVGSETDWRGRGASDRMTPFDAKVPEREKVDQILAWLDRPEPERPRLIMAYWRGADHAGHRHGPDSDEVTDAVRKQDVQLVRLLAGLDARNRWADTTLLLVSDHGMVQVDRPIDARAVLREAHVGARVVHASALAHVHLKDPTDAAAKQGAIDALSAREGVSAYATDQLPPALRYSHGSRVGQVVAIASPPHVFRSGAHRLFGRALRAVGRTTGAHGYDPAVVPEMSGIFLALGRGAAKGARLPALRAIDLAPTVAALLGIEPPEHSEGSAVDLAAPAS